MKQILTLVCIITSLGLSNSYAVVSFDLSWEETPNQIWTGPEGWANRLQDWRVESGRVECIPNRNLPLRTLSLLSHDLTSNGSSFELNTELGFIESETSNTPDGASQNKKRVPIELSIHANPSKRKTP